MIAHRVLLHTKAFRQLTSCHAFIARRREELNGSEPGFERKRRKRCDCNFVVHTTSHCCAVEPCRTHRKA